jgi:radical SAM protein with 4Fe4S-binding SPASM domain
MSYVDIMKTKWKKCKHRSANEMRITFMMTSECNFRCKYCYEHKQPGSLSIDDAFSVLDHLFPIDDEYWRGYISSDVKKNSITFDFFGGEAILEIDNIDKICQHFLDLCESSDEYSILKDNFKFEIESNGALIRTSKVINFIKKWEKYISEIGITIDGSQKCHDACRVFKDTGKPTWQIVHDNILWLKKEFPNIKLATKGTLVPDNVEYLYESFVEYQKMGYKNIPVTIALGIDKPWPEDKLQVFREQLDLIINDLLKMDTDNISFGIFDSKYDEFHTNFFEFALARCASCGSDGSMLVVTPLGELTFCPSLANISFGPRETYAIGYAKTGITDIGLERIEAMRCAFPNILYDPKSECVWCTAKGICESVCPAMSYSQTGDFSKQLTVNECKAHKVYALARAKYNYLKEKQLWTKKENQ